MINKSTIYCANQTSGMLSHHNRRKTFSKDQTPGTESDHSCQADHASQHRARKEKKKKKKKKRFTSLWPSLSNSAQCHTVTTACMSSRLCNTKALSGYVVYCSTVQYSIMQYHAMQCSITSYNTILCNVIVQHSLGVAEPPHVRLYI